MRPIRALVLLLAAFAIAAVAPAQACMAGAASRLDARDAPAHSAPGEHGRLHHTTADRVPAGGIEGCAHDGGPGKSRQAKRHACQPACCFAPIGTVVRTDGAVLVPFFMRVHYATATPPFSGRTFSPDPGIPKQAA